MAKSFEIIYGSKAYDLLKTGHICEHLDLKHNFFFLLCPTALVRMA